MKYKKSFLKWAGGKYRLLDEIFKVVPQTSSDRRYVEPFCGGGTVYINTDYPRYLISDINKDLINVYTYLKMDNSFINYNDNHFLPYYNEKAIYITRRTLYNNLNTGKEKAALFIYLNRHCFNGLCRYNSKGEFNVPFGKYKKVAFPRDSMSIFRHKLQNTEIKCINYSDIILESNDVVYCDPPYVPLSDTANFTSYSGNQFGSKEQAELAEWAEDNRADGRLIVISNHDTDVTRSLYKNANEIISFEVQRNISASSKGRNKVKELLAIYRSS